MISIKVYDNMNNWKIENINFEYGFKFYVCMYPNKLQVRQSKQSTYPCFHPKVEIDKEPLWKKYKGNPSLQTKVNINSKIDVEIMNENLPKLHM